ncbi:MAG: oligosaccharide flippase family protein [Pseudomonadota bacterium]
MLGKSMALLSGNAGAALLLLARNLLVARLIPVEDYGIAATFAVTMALVEMSTQFGLQQQIVQDRDGDDPKFQHGVQGFQLLRGAVAGALVFALAAPIAAMFRIPDVAWAYQVLAILPVLRALQHFDIHRLNRTLRYGPMLWTSGAPALLSLAAIAPLNLWLGDYRVMLAALLIYEASAALTSHLVAERPYRVTLDRQVLRRSIRFGWPLLLNGALLFLVMQGDKLIVGRELGMTALAVFGMGVTLTLTPTLILAKTLQNVFLPTLATAEGNDDHWRTLVRRLLHAALACAVLLTASVLLFGPPLIDLLLGQKFSDLVPVLMPLALVHAFRVIKAGPTIVALAAGETARLAWANLPRVAALLPAWAWAAHGASLLELALLAAAAEAASLLVTLAVTRAILRVSLRDFAGPALYAMAVLGMCLALGLGWQPGPDWAAGMIILVLSFGAAWPLRSTLPRRMR